MIKTLIERVIEAQLEAVREMDPEVGTRLEDLDEEELRDEGIVVQAAIRAVLQEMIGNKDFISGNRPTLEHMAMKKNNADDLIYVFKFMVEQFAEENGIEV